MTGAGERDGGGTPGSFASGCFGPGSFGAAARHLAGIAGCALGWRADEFWAATPAEMEAIIRVMMGGGGGGGMPTPPDRAHIARLQEIFPDG